MTDKMVQLAYSLSVALRRDEVTSLQFKDCKKNQIRLVDSYSIDMKKNKGCLKDVKKRRDMHPTDFADSIIETIRNDRIERGLSVDGSVFCVEDSEGNTKYSAFYTALGKTLNTYCDELGIQRRSVHKMRKTVASIMHAGGIDDLIIQEELGHKDLSTTFNSYCYDMTEELEKQMAINEALGVSNPI